MHAICIIFHALIMQNARVQRYFWCLYYRSSRISNKKWTSNQHFHSFIFYSNLIDFNHLIMLCMCLMFQTERKENYFDIHLIFLYIYSESFKKFSLLYTFEIMFCCWLCLCCNCSSVGLEILDCHFYYFWGKKKKKECHYFME